MIEIFVRDPDFVITDQVDDFTKFTGIVRYRDVGSAALDMPFCAASLALSEPGAGILISEDGKELFSGITREPQRKYSANADGQLFAFLTDETVLNDTLVYPCARVLQGDGTYKFPTSAYDIRTDDAETIMHKFALANAGPISVSYPWTRPIVPLTFAPNLSRGPTITGRGRMQTLLELEQTLGIAGGLGFNVTNMQFAITVPVDRSDEIVFSTEIGNMVDFVYSRTRPEATHMVVAGQGEGVDRVFVIGGDNALATRWGWRIESFRDRRDTDDIDELNQTLGEELVERGEKAGFSLTPQDLTGYAFGVDYQLGDVVTGEADSQTIAGSINQVTITLDENGKSVKPDFSASATAQAFLTLRTFDILRNQQRRINALERTL